MNCALCASAALQLMLLAGTHTERIVRLKQSSVTRQGRK
jgi:hypothetical protein